MTDIKRRTWNKFKMDSRVPSDSVGVEQLYSIKTICSYKYIKIYLFDKVKFVSSSVNLYPKVFSPESLQFF